MSIVNLATADTCDGCGGGLVGTAVLMQQPKGEPRTYHMGGCSEVEGARGCPFCGGRPTLIGIGALSATLECRSARCRAEVRVRAEDPERAVALWNGKG